MFHTRLNYSLGNEDFASEFTALDLRPDDNVLSITGSGDRPLNLLVKHVASVVSIDSNKVQNQLLRLKCAAMKCLDYDQFQYFLGLTRWDKQKDALLRSKYGTRLEMLDEKIIHNVTHLETQRALQVDGKLRKMVSKGIVYEGKVEKSLRLLAKFTRLFIGAENVEGLFNCQTLEEQTDFVYAFKKKKRVKLWMKWFHITFNTCRKRLGDPGLDNVDPTVDGGKYMLDSMFDMCNYRLAKESIMLSLMFRGYVGNEALSPYLRQEFFADIASRVDNIHVIDDDLLSYLATTSNRFSGFSMSDVISYLSPQNVELLLKGMQRCKKIGEVQFILREYLTKHEISSLNGKCIWNEDLETFLDHHDSCFLYRFKVGRLVD